MKTFKITFEGRCKDQPPVKEDLTQRVLAANPAAAVMALYESFDVLDVHAIEEVTEFNTAEYLRHNRPSQYPRDRDDPPAPDTESPFSESIGAERCTNTGVG